ncbi:hypothetical protein BpHYR1_002063 [Brachionus plicatilis]|uniref:Uncharacterized protein n=1 Tax=Brachionus plicatilis TaxID=10195 RepID=A0A3M7QYV7_BRAPC|nr:hypothetical protein BpHYR1_002063 [Brachionus plicatilis]
MKLLEMLYFLNINMAFLKIVLLNVSADIFNRLIESLQKFCNLILITCSYLIIKLYIIFYVSLKELLLFERHVKLKPVFDKKRHVVKIEQLKNRCAYQKFSLIQLESDFFIRHFTLSVNHLFGARNALLFYNAILRTEIALVKSQNTKSLAYRDAKILIKSNKSYKIFRLDVGDTLNMSADKIYKANFGLLEKN